MVYNLFYTGLYYCLYNKINSLIHARQKVALVVWNMARTDKEKSQKTKVSDIFSYILYIQVYMYACTYIYMCNCA